MGAKSNPRRVVLPHIRWPGAVLDVCEQTRYGGGAGMGRYGRELPRGVGILRPCNKVRFRPAGSGRRVASVAETPLAVDMDCGVRAYHRRGHTDSRLAVARIVGCADALDWIAPQVSIRVASWLALVQGQHLWHCALEMTGMRECDLYAYRAVTGAAVPVDLRVMCGVVGL